MNRVYARGSDSGMNNFGIHNQSSQANSSLPEMEHITAEASGDNSINKGITVGSLGHVTLNNTSIRVSGNDSVNYGIDISGASLSLRDTKILTQGANGSSIGIRLTNAESEITAQFVTIDAVNSGSIGTQTIGFDAGADTSSELFNVYFTASGGGNVSVGVIASLGESGDMRISHSHISASAASARGISVENSPSDSLKIINSEIHGSTNSIFNISTANVSIGSTQLSNPIGTAGSGYSFVCVTSFDENFNSLGEGCL